MYSSGYVFSQKQTGGMKRFIELSGSFKRADEIEFTLVGQDDSEIFANMGFTRSVSLQKAKTGGLYNILPPEMSILLSNRNEVNCLKKREYDKIIVFDVPPAIGLVLFGFKNIVLMIRKDMIGYERVINHRWSVYPKLLFQWFCESLCMIRCSSIICQCDYDKRQLMKRHPLIAKTIERKTIIQINNVNPSWIVNNRKKNLDDIRIEETGRFRVCFVGDFDSPRKGHQLLLEAATEILKYDSNIEFIFVGGGLSLDLYRTKYGSDYIRFTGRMNNPNEVLKKSNLSVVPSFADSCPNTVMEALYNGIPVIGSKAGGIPEILLDEDALFELNVNSLVNAILKLKDNPQELHYLKERQVQRCKELTFDWGEKMVEQITE